MSSTLYMIAFIKRRPDLTEEQFYNHWRNIHAPKIAYWAKKNGIIGYTQVSRLVKEISSQIACLTSFRFTPLVPCASP